MSFLVISRENVREHLSYETCIPLMRQAMIALSRGATSQMLRSIIDLERGRRCFGIMPGAMAAGPFGARIPRHLPRRPRRNAVAPGCAGPFRSGQRSTGLPGRGGQAPPRSAPQRLRPPHPTCWPTPMRPGSQSSPFSSREEEWKADS